MTRGGAAHFTRQSVLALAGSRRATPTSCRVCQPYVLSAMCGAPTHAYDGVARQVPLMLQGAAGETGSGDTICRSDRPLGWPRMGLASCPTARPSPEAVPLEVARPRQRDEAE